MTRTETIQNIVARRRRQLGLTQEELAERVSVTRQTVISIEKGNYVPSLLLAIKLARVFGAAVEEVFSYEGR
jgi:putative transcriptional regulator